MKVYSTFDRNQRKNIKGLIGLVLLHYDAKILERSVFKGWHLIGGLLIAFAEITMLANNLRSDGLIKTSEIQYAQMRVS